MNISNVNYKDLDNLKIQHRSLAVFVFLHLLFSLILIYQDCMLSIQKPIIFDPRLDIIHYLVFNYTWTLIVDSMAYRYWLDLSWMVIPVVVYWVYVYGNQCARTIAVFVWILVELVYGMTLDATSIYHYEIFMMFCVACVLWFPKSERGYYFVFNMFRYYFLMIFASAGLWKIRTGSAFEVDQMSGILWYQHSQYLISCPEDTYSKLIGWMIFHPKVSFLVYWIGLVTELLFLVGFFTKKFDRWLLVLFIGFLIFDYVFMRINYAIWIGNGIALYDSSRVYYSRSNI